MYPCDLPFLHLRRAHDARGGVSGVLTAGRPAAKGERWTENVMYLSSQALILVNRTRARRFLVLARFGRKRGFRCTLLKANFHSQIGGREEELMSVAAMQRNPEIGRASCRERV